MNFKNGSIYIIAMLLILFLSISMVSASEISADDTVNDASDDSVVDSGALVSDVSDDSELIADDSISNDVSQISDADEINDLNKANKSYYSSSGLSDNGNIIFYYTPGPYLKDSSIGIKAYDSEGFDRAVNLDIYFNDEYATTIMTDEYEEVYVSLSDLNIGKNNITVKYNGSDYFNPAEETKDFVLYGQNSLIDIELIGEMALGEHELFNFTLLASDSETIINDNFTIYLGRYDEYSEYELLELIRELTLNGKDFIEIDNNLIDRVGPYEIHLLYGGSEDYQYAPYEYFAYFNVYDILAEIVSDCPEYVVPGQDLEFTLSLIDASSGNFLEDKEFRVKIYYDEDGEDYVLYDETVQKSKDYVIPAETLEGIDGYFLYVSAFMDSDNDYNCSSAQLSEIVSLGDSRLPTHIYSDIGDAVFGNETEVSISLYSDEDYECIVGNVNVYLNDEYLTTLETTLDDENPVKMVLKDLKNGINSLRLEFTGNDIYKDYVYVHDFGVYYVESSIDIDAANIIVGETLNISINLTEKESGKLINKTAQYYVLSEEDDSLINNGEFNASTVISLDNLEIGEYRTVVVFEDEDDFYSPDRNTLYFEVYPAESVIDIGGYSFADNEDVVFKIFISDMVDRNMEGIVKIDFNGTNYTVNVTKDGTELNIGKLPIDTYLLYAEFDGNDQFNGTSLHHDFRVEKGTIIKIDACDVLKGKSETVNICFTDTDGKALDLTWLDFSIFDIAKGEYLPEEFAYNKTSFELKNITGDYVIYARYSPDYDGDGYMRYHYSTGYGFIRALDEEPAVVPVNANANIELSLAGSTVIVSLKDLEGNAIANASLKASVGDKNSTLTTDDDGKAVLSIGANETAKVTYTDANNASVSSILVNNVINITIEKNNTIIEYVNVTPNRTATKIIYSDMNTKTVAKADGRIGEYFEVVLVDADGKALADKKVQIGFNGKVYNRTTNETGGVKLQINLPRADLYTFAVCFLGDDEYTGSFEVAKITVTKQAPKLTAAGKTYKASAKTKSVSATIKTANGKAVSGKSVVFIVNGKLYNAKTNSKGVATVKVSLSKKGTYTCTVNAPEDDTFTATSTKFKLKIA